MSTVTGAPGPGVGTYSLTGFGSGSYTVTPTKTGGQNASITSFDAARIAQFVAGGVVFSPAQLTVADVSGAGGISSFDAAFVGRWAVSTPGAGQTGNWRFDPVSNTHPSITSDISGEDYLALLMGEVSGNWANTGARPVGSGSDGNITVELPTVAVSVDKEYVVPVNVQGIADKGIIAYEFDLRYDPSVILPQAVPVDVLGTVSRGLIVVTNTEEAGLLRVALYGPMPLTADGVLLNLRFTAVGEAGSTSSLTWERIIFNEGEPVTIATEGRIELSTATQDQP